MQPEDKTYQYIHYACTTFYSHKWQLSIILDLCSGPKRFGEMLRLHEGLSRKMLSYNLHKLEDKGVIIRSPYKEGEIQMVEYSLSQQGRELQKILEELSAWGGKYYQNYRNKNEDE